MQWPSPLIATKNVEQEWKNQMSYQEELSQWTQTVSTHLAHLSRPQVAVLATWSYALIFLQRCGLSRASL